MELQSLFRRVISLDVHQAVKQHPGLNSFWAKSAAWLTKVIDCLYPVLRRCINWLPCL